MHWIAALELSVIRVCIYPTVSDPFELQKFEALPVHPSVTAFLKFERLRIVLTVDDYRHKYSRSVTCLTFFVHIIDRRPKFLNVQRHFAAHLYDRYAKKT